MGDTTANLFALKLGAGGNDTGAQTLLSWWFSFPMCNYSSFHISLISCGIFYLMIVKRHRSKNDCEKPEVIPASSSTTRLSDGVVVIVSKVL